MTKDDKEPKAYEVGYHKPPQHTRFKKGQSGNPKGRAKKKNIDDVRPVIEEILEQAVPIDDGGKKYTISRMQAILEAERKNALNGNLRAIEALLKKAERCGLFSKAKPLSGIIITEPDGDAGRIARMLQLEQDPKPGLPPRYYDALRAWRQP